MIDEQQFNDLKASFDQLAKSNEEYEKFFKDVEPFAMKMEEAPELAKLIAEKDTTYLKDLAQAAADGRITKEDAKAVADAAAQVKQEVGKDKFEAMDPSRIERLITEKLNDATKDMKEAIGKVSEEQAVQAAASDAAAFIDKTPDFEKYADRVLALDQEHPEFKSDVRTLYMMAKGEESLKASSEGNKAAETEAMKAAVAGAMPSPIAVVKGVPIYSDRSVADQYVETRRSANSYI